jgi:hypothetical protein
MTVQQLSFAKLYLASGRQYIELVGAPQEVMERIALGVAHLEHVKLIPVSKAEAYVELYASKAGAGCFLEHSFDIIANEERRAKASSILISLSKRLGVGMVYEPVGFSYR